MDMSDTHRSQNQSFIHTTPSVCPTCFKVVNAQIIDRDGKVYMRKFCPDHGHCEVLISGDSEWYRETLAVKYTPLVPHEFTSKVERGCPHDCGICADHQQRCLIPVIEITDHCNMKCPICFAHNRNRYHMTVEEMDRSLDTVEKSEGTDVDAMVITGGEPTLHPEFFVLMQRLVVQPVEVGAELPRESPHRLEAGEVQGHHPHRGVRGRGHDPRGHVTRLRRLDAGHDGRRASTREDLQCLEPDPAVAAGDYDNLAAQVGHSVRGPFPGHRASLCCVVIAS
jgi:hypothetical protein